MPRVLFDAIAVGDVRPIAVRVMPSDQATVTSATYTITRSADPDGTVFDPGGACLIENNNAGSTISTPTFITFPTADTYTVRFTLTWNDGQVDSTVVVSIPVVNSGCSC